MSKIHKALKQKLNKARDYENCADCFQKAKKMDKAVEYYTKAVEKYMKLAELEQGLKISQQLMVIHVDTKNESALIVQMRTTLKLLEMLKHTRMESLLLKIKLADLLVFHTSKKGDIEEAIKVRSQAL